jgi:glyoxylase-like metal-dependent hydrolase (beta-lactamase superfamily II)
MTDLIIEKIISGPNFTNCYLVHNTKNLWIIDPPQIDDKISDYISTNKLKPAKIINTHGHIDHIFANHYYKKLYDIPLAIHKDDGFLLEFDWSTFSTSYPPNYQSIKPDILLSNKSKLNLDDFQFYVIHTPGHSPGSICLKH